MATVTTLPLPGAPYTTPNTGTGALDARNPTLVPNFDRSVSVSNFASPIETYTINHSSPNEFLGDHARVAATVALTIATGVTTGDINLVTFTFGTVGQVVSVSYTTAAGDSTVALLAGSIAAAITNNQTARSEGIWATAAGAVITLYCDGPIGNTVTAAYTCTASGGGAGTSTGSLANSGVLSGGSGPIFPTNNFIWSMSGGTTAFFYGIPAIVGYDVLLALVNQQMPIS